MIAEILEVAKEKNLTPAQTLLLGVFCEGLEDGEAVHVTAEELAELTGFGVRTVRRSVSALISAGLLSQKGVNFYERECQNGTLSAKMPRSFNDLFQKKCQNGTLSAKMATGVPNWQPAIPALPSLSPYSPPFGIPPYNPPTQPTHPPRVRAEEAPGAQGGREREMVGLNLPENTPAGSPATTPLNETPPIYPLECPKFPFVTVGGIDLPPTATNRVKGHFLPSERDFLKVYGKQPLTNETFNQFVEAFAEAEKDVGLPRLIECARMEVENVRAENGGSSQKLRRPEVFLSDRAYRDWLPKLPATVNAGSTASSSYGSYLDSIDFGF